jgi:hypothetical protein
MMSPSSISEPAAGISGSGAEGERRRSRRAQLHWVLYLACNGAGRPFRTRTKNISSGGFYCAVDHAVKPGDQFECDILVPTHASLDPDDVVCLRCRAQAVRVEIIRESAEFGLACRIQDYFLIHGSNIRFRISSAPQID